MNVFDNLNSVQIINKPCVCTRTMRLSALAALRCDREQECYNLGWTDNPSTLRRNVTVVNCHSGRFVGWTLSLGRNVAWSVCRWTDRLGTMSSWLNDPMAPWPPFCIIYCMQTPHMHSTVCTVRSAQHSMFFIYIKLEFLPYNVRHR